jgi:hypothetical protein
MGRMATNIDAIGASGARVVVAGGDLLQLAAQFYGDAGEWATIARANGLTDPVLDGVRSILIPPMSANCGGVLREILSGADSTLIEVIAAVSTGFGELDIENPDGAIWTAAA